MQVNNKVKAAAAAAFLACCMAFTAPSEGVTYKAIQDTGGKWTICNGHTRNVQQGDTATEDDCKQFLAEDTQIAIDDFNMLVTGGENIPPETRKVFVDQVFNSGAGSLRGTIMLSKIRAGDITGACRRFSLWIKATVPKGSVKDMRDGVRDGKADCRIRENQCFGIVKRRAKQEFECLKGLNP